MGKFIIEIDSEIKDIVPGFLENRKKDLTTISVALDSGDYTQIQIIGHKMKGSSGGYGFDGLGAIGSVLEALAKIKDSPGIKKQLLAMEDYLANVEVVYK